MKSEFFCNPCIAWKPASEYGEAYGGNKNLHRCKTCVDNISKRAQRFESKPKTRLYKVIDTLSQKKKEYDKKALEREIERINKEAFSYD